MAWARCPGAYYAAHNFLLISPADGSGCIGIFVDFPGKVSYDIGYTRHDTLRFATAEPNYALYLITAPTAAEVAKEFRQLIGPSYIPPKWAFGLAQSRFGYKTEADIREVAQPAANTAQLDDTSLTLWACPDESGSARCRMYTDDGETSDFAAPEHWKVLGSN